LNSVKNDLPPLVEKMFLQTTRNRVSPTRTHKQVCANKGGRYKRPAFTMLRVTFWAKAHFDDWLSVFVLMYSITMPLRPQIATRCYFCMVLLAIVVIFTVDNGAAKREWLVFIINNTICFKSYNYFNTIQSCIKILHISHKF